MPRQDNLDFLTAFAVGAVLGVGTALLLQPSPTPKERVVKQWKPYRKQMKKSYGEAREVFADAGGATGEMSSELVSAGKELLGEFRSEVAKVLRDARGEMEEIVEDQSKDLSKKLRKARRKFGV